MVNIELLENLEIQVNTGDIEYLRALKDHFSDYVPNYRFMPQFRMSGWDGKVYLFNTTKRSVPYGLLTDLMLFHKENFPKNKINIEQKVKDLFNNNMDYTITYGNLIPREYQREQVEGCLKFTKGIIRAATASGKSYSIYSICKTILENGLSDNVIIIVPTLSLIEQMKDDFIKYGEDQNIISTVSGSSKDFSKKIVISTWQSLMKKHKELERFEAFVVDEVHHAKATEILKITKALKNAIFRFGFTGTLPTDKLSLWNIKSYIGPIIKEYSSGDLADLGFIAKCNIKMIYIDYVEEYDGDYSAVRDQVFNNPFRMSFILNLVSSINDNILLLVGKVEDEGEVLKSYFNLGLKDKEIVFLSGRNSAEEREYWRKEFVNRKNLVLIATYGIFSTGINIPSLKHIIFVSPFKSKIRVLQSIGRALRKHINKEEGAYIYDICDNTKFLKKQSLFRLRYYDSERFSVEESNIKETEDENSLYLEEIL